LLLLLKITDSIPETEISGIEDHLLACTTKTFRVRIRGVWTNAVRRTRRPAGRDFDHVLAAMFRLFTCQRAGSKGDGRPSRFTAKRLQPLFAMHSYKPTTTGFRQWPPSVGSRIISWRSALSTPVAKNIFGIFVDCWPRSNAGSDLSAGWRFALETTSPPADNLLITLILRSKEVRGLIRGG